MSLIGDPLRNVVAEALFHAHAPAPFTLLLFVELTKLVVSLALSRSIKNLSAYTFSSVLIVAANGIFFYSLKWFNASILAILLSNHVTVSVLIKHMLKIKKTNSLGFLGIFLVLAGTFVTLMGKDFAYDSIWAFCNCIAISICFTLAPLLSHQPAYFWDNQLRLSFVGTIFSLVLVALSKNNLARTFSHPDTIYAVAFCIFATAASNILSYLEASKESTLYQASPFFSSIITILTNYFKFGTFPFDTIPFVIGIASITLGLGIFISSSHAHPKNHKKHIDQPNTKLFHKATPTKLFKLFSRRLIATRILFLAFLIFIIRTLSIIIQHSLAVEYMSKISPSEWATRTPVDFDTKHLCFVDPRDVESKTIKLDDTSVINTINNECHLVSPIAIRQCSVPKVVHLVSINANYTFFHYLAIKSMHDKIKPHAIFIHGYNFPMNEKNFRRIYTEFNPILINSRNPSAIDTNLAELIRIETVLRFGGMIFDLDVLVLKPFTPFFIYETVMPQHPLGSISTSIIIAKRCSRFLRRYHSAYITSNPAVNPPTNLPTILYDQNRRDIHVDHTALRHVSNSYIFDSTYMSSLFVRIHAIYASTSIYSKQHSFEDVKSLDTNYGRFARNVLYDGPNLGE